MVRKNADVLGAPASFSPVWNPAAVIVRTGSEEVEVIGRRKRYGRRLLGEALLSGESRVRDPSASRQFELQLLQRHFEGSRLAYPSYPPLPVTKIPSPQPDITLERFWLYRDRAFQRSFD